MEKQFANEDSVLRCRNNAVRPTCSVLPSQETDQVLQRQDTENGERSRKLLKSDAHKSVDNQAEVIRKRGKSSRIRSKTFDPSLLSHVQNDNESKTQRKKLPQSCYFPWTNSQYHKIFKEISETEQLKQSYTCALQKDILYQGRLFVSDNWICFHSKVFGKNTKVAIPVTSVTNIKKTKTAMLVPNALIIATAQERYGFVSFLSRDATFKVLMSVCFHLDYKCQGNSPTLSPAHRNYRTTPPVHAMSFSADLSDLDASAVQRRPAKRESSSSDSPYSPEYDKLSEYSKECNVFMNVVKQDSISDTRPQQPKHKWNVDVKAMKPNLLNVLLTVYLLLVCILLLSSCYMAFKIISLEQRLVSMAEFPHNGDEYSRAYTGDSSGFHSSLSTNLWKLEKIQRSIQRLLEETQ